MFRNALSPREIAACANLGPAVKPTVVDQRFALCLYCQVQTGQVCASDRGGRVCRCPECEPVPVNADDIAALVLDESWLRAKLRLALDINSRDGIDELGDGVWPLGEARRAPVLLARTLTRVWGEPALFDRVRVQGAAIRVIAPLPGRPVARPSVQGSSSCRWRSDSPSTVEASRSSPRRTPPRRGRLPPDPTAQVVYGPFSADFRWMTLADWPHGLIRCTNGQAAIFEALRSFKGKPMSAEPMMRSAGLDSAKPSDLFKVKTRDKGRPESEGPLFGYRTLVNTRQRDGLYWMPCAADQSPSSM